MSSKVELKRLVPGDGKNYPQYGQIVRVHYTAMFHETKTKIDSSRDRGAPFEFKVGAGEVIRAWDLILPSLSVGERALISASPNEAYGSSGIPGLIPPNAKLLFDIQLLALK